jgi:glycerol transport system ATP-binding protein
MNAGEVVQIGTPIDLFERPQHTFVGHFIGSPGMNVLPCELRTGGAFFGGEMVQAANAAAARGTGRTEIGVRPEFVSIASSGIPADIVRVSDAGRFRILETRAHGQSVKLLLPEQQSVPEGKTFLAFDPAHTQVYEDGWMAGAKA